MALDYVTNPTGLFFRAGHIVKALNAYKPTATATYPADLKSIVDPYENSDLTPQVATLYATYAGLQDQITAIRQTLASYIETTFTDQATVLAQLGLLAGASDTDILLALYRQMQLDAQTVRKCVVTLGTATAGGANAGNGSLFITTTMDGATPPRTDADPNPRYQNVPCELGVVETMLMVCTADGDSGATDGETFSWVGQQNYDRLAWQPEGSGQGPSLSVLNAANVVQNGEFESWTVTANQPDSWALGAGTVAGTHVFQTTPAGANVYRGQSSVLLQGDGALGTVEINQPLAGLSPLTGYALAIAIKCSNTGTVGKNLTVQVTGTGMSPLAAETVQLSGGSLPTGWTVYGRFWHTPALMPPDLTVRVQLTGTWPNTTQVYVDMCVIGGVTWHGGVGAFFVAGTAPFVVADRWTFTVTNDNAGIWQRFWREWFRAQLPSATSGSETVPDSLAS